MSYRSALALLIIAAGAAANFVKNGLLIHTWLGWPLWAQAGSLVLAAALFVALNGPAFGLIFFLILCAAVFLLRGPDPVYDVDVELIAPEGTIAPE